MQRATDSACIQISILALVLIAIPLFLFALFALVVDAIYVAFQSDAYESQVSSYAFFALQTTTLVTRGLATVLSLAAIVAIGRREEKITEGPSLDSGAHMDERELGRETVS